MNHPFMNVGAGSLDQKGASTQDSSGGDGIVAQSGKLLAEISQLKNEMESMRDKMRVTEEENVTYRERF